MSLQAHELRIGNWVETYMVLSSGSWYDKEGNRHGEEKITEPTIRQKQIDLEDLQIIHKAGGLATYRGITLTPEVLAATGWKYSKIDGVARISDDFEEPDGDTEYWELGKLTIVSWDKGPLTLSNSSSFDHRIELKHLHQLQNIVYALTDKELEYNPK